LISSFQISNFNSIFGLQTANQSGISNFIDNGKSNPSDTENSSLKSSSPTSDKTYKPQETTKEKSKDKLELSSKSTVKSDSKSKSKDGELTDEQKEMVQKLKERDNEVRRHEAAHLAASGGHAKGGPTFTTTTGPDGKQYAIGGEVQIDMSPVKGNPEATIAKMQAVKRAALAPSEPSGQDTSVASAAASMEAEARQELSAQKVEEQSGGNKKTSSTSGLLQKAYSQSTFHSSNDLGSIINFSVQSKTIAGFSCCSGTMGCSVCSPKIPA
jgi:hypothetical protein